MTNYLLCLLVVSLWQVPMYFLGMNAGHQDSQEKLGNSYDWRDSLSVMQTAPGVALSMFYALVLWMILGVIAWAWGYVPDILGTIGATGLEALEK